MGYCRVRGYLHAGQHSRDIRIRRSRGATADDFRRFQDAVNEAVVVHARGIIDARGPGAPTGPAHWDAGFQATIHQLRLRDGALLELHHFLHEPPAPSSAQ
jgi:hypothetical protein